MPQPIFRKIDCHMLKVTDLDAAIAFYAGELGHALLWRTDSAAGFALPESDSELVVNTQLGPETDLLVDDTAAAYDRLLSAGARTIMPPFDIVIGKCAVVCDPFGNRLTILDQSKGVLETDKQQRVTSVGPRS